MLMGRCPAASLRDLAPPGYEERERALCQAGSCGTISSRYSGDAMTVEGKARLSEAGFFLPCRQASARPCKIAAYKAEPPERPKIRTEPDRWRRPIRGRKIGERPERRLSSAHREGDSPDRPRARRNDSMARPSGRKVGPSASDERTL